MSDGVSYQPFPIKPKWISLDPADFNVPEGDEVRAFPHHEIFLDEDDGTFIQTRSSPNWQGGMMTFSTCKQHMRTFKDRKEWEGVWLAGFTPISTTGGSFLLYVAQVQEAFPSNMALSLYLSVTSRDVWQAKRAAEDPCGDVYDWKPPAGKQLGDGSQWDVTNYVPPPADHTRSELQSDGMTPKWHKDIAYKGNGDRHPPVFVLRPASLWTRPKFVASVPLHRSGWKCTGKELKERVQLR